MNQTITSQSSIPPAFIKPSRNLSAAILLGLCLSWTASTVSAQQVVTRARLGNNTEDLEFIPSGRYANQLAIIDGYDVLIMPATARRPEPAYKLFDVKTLPMAAGPRGIAYLESERLFVFTDVILADQLFFTDENGANAGTRTITFPADVTSLGSESVSYIRRGSAFYPDHLLLVIYAAPDYSSRIEVVRRDGVVVAEIVPDAVILEHGGCASASYVGPDRLLIGTSDGLLFLTDLHGHAVAGPVPVEPGESCEGVTQLANGRLVAASYASGKALSFDANLNRLPDADLDFKTGIGITRPLGLTWNPNANELLLISGAIVQALPATLDARRPVLDLTADGLEMFQRRDLTYLPNENRIGIGTINPHQILVYGSSGVREEVISLSPLGGPSIAQYLPDSDQFALFLRNRANRGLLRIIQRDGTLSSTIDLRPFGVSSACLAYFRPSQLSESQFLVIDPVNDAMLTIDRNGNLLSSFAFRDALSMPTILAVTAITTGPHAGAFAAVNGENSEVVIFTLP